MSMPKSGSSYVHGDDRAKRQSEELDATQATGVKGSEASLSTSSDEKQLVEVSIPNIFRPLFHCVIGQYLYVEDDFTQRARKLAFVAFLVTANFGLFAAIYFFFRYGNSTVGLADLFLGFGMSIMCISFNTLYLIFRKKRQVTDTMTFLGIMTASFIWTTTHFCSAGFDLRLTDLVIMSLAILTSTPHLKWTLVYHCLLYVQDLYNDSYENTGVTMLRVPSTRAASGFEPLVMKLSSLPSAILVLAAMYSTMKESMHQLHVARKSITLAREVTEELRRYNIENVQSLVEAAKLDKESNLPLLMSFASMAFNLEQYRPHLPNYLFLNEDDSSQDGECAAGDGGSLARPSAHDSSPIGTNGNLLAVGRPVAAVASVSSAGRSTEDEDMTLVMSFTQSLEGSEGPRPVAGDEDDIVDDEDDQLSLTSRTSKIGVGVLHLGGGDYSPAYRGLISCAWIELQCNEWFGRGGSTTPTTTLVSAPRKPRMTGSPTTAAKKRALASPEGGGGYGNAAHRLTEITNAIYELAKSGKASIHSTVGDKVVLSWNATHRVMQPEIKGAKFLLKLRNAIESHLEGVKVAGACCSGRAEVHNVFSAATKQQAMYLDASWLPALDGCYNLARRHKTLVIDANTETGATFNVVAQGIDCIRYRPAVSSAASSGGMHEKPGAAAYPKLNQVAVGFSNPRPEVFDTLMGTKGPQHVGTFGAHALESSVMDDSVNSNRGGLNQSIVRYTLAFELLNDREQEEDEWMYQLERQESTMQRKTEVVVTQALVAMVEGKSGEAAELLNWGDGKRPEGMRYTSLFKQLDNHIHTAVQERRMGTGAGLASPQEIVTFSIQPDLAPVNVS